MKNSEFVSALEKSGMTVREAVILASVIEKEAGNKEDMPLVSSVFHNRLEKGMKLQSCATFNYTLPKEERKSALSAEQIATDSPYNTYMYEGLPPGLRSVIQDMTHFLPLSSLLILIIYIFALRVTVREPLLCRNG